MVTSCVGSAIQSTLLKERWIAVRRRRGRGCKQLLDDLKERGEYWKLKEETLDRTLWKTGFGRGNGLVRETTGLMNELIN